MKVPGPMIGKGGSSYDADAQAFFTAAGISDTTQKAAVNQLVLDLKSNSLWSKMSAIYPFVGGSAACHKYNLKDPRDLDAAFRLAFSGTWTHNATGAKPNGSTGYADTFLNPNTVYSDDAQSMGCYINTIPGAFADKYAMGGHSGSTHFDAINYDTATDAYFIQYANATRRGVASTDLRGFWQGTTDGANGTCAWNSTIRTRISTSGNRCNATFYIGALNLIGTGAYGFTNGSFALAYFGLPLADADLTNMNTLVQTFETSLSRNV